MALARGTRCYERGRVLAGGEPFRVMRLTAAGADALAKLAAGEPAVAQHSRVLGARLVAAGLATPRPPAPATLPSITVAVPTRDRPRSLARCLAALAPEAPDVLVVDDGSADASTVAAVCARHGARLLRRPVAGGPAAARNAALAACDNELVAFLDDDTEPCPGWLAILAAHFADPGTAAVAARVTPAPEATDRGWRARYVAACSPLDLGAEPGSVRPGSALPYVPAAALVVRRAALGGGFDERLRFGEDVDLCWRLHAADWSVRYEPRALVRHREPAGWAALLARRFAYGSSAAPLSQRHPELLAPVSLAPLPALAAALALGGRPRAALAVALATPLPRARALHRAGLPAAAIAALGPWGAWMTLSGLGRAAVGAGAPMLVAAALVRPTRRVATALAAAHVASAWRRRRPALDPLRFAVATLLDEAAYGAGVWRGCLDCNTLRPLRPRLARRARAR